MRKAFDTVLQSEVSADLVAQGGGVEPYRYECAKCGEEVYLAAHYSTRMVTHFRHRSGNNDVECESYLGQFGIISTDSRSRKSNRERAEFYFDYLSKTFSLGLRFSESEIVGYEMQDVDFELRVSDSDRPFRTLKINSMNFSHEVPTMITLNTFSYSYYLSNTCNGTQRRYDFFNRNNPTFFKILVNDENFKAKLVRGTVLYTNTDYFVAIQSRYSVYKVFEGINIDKTFHFDTMGNRFAGIVLKISKKTPQIDLLIRSWGYQLEVSETLTLLWPPATLIDDMSVIDYDDNAFLHTSFALQAHGNINLHSEYITQITDRITKIVVKPKTKVFKKNVEILIDKRKENLSVFDEVYVEKSTEKTFTVPDDRSYFLFNLSGVALLSKGQLVSLSPQSIIRNYLSGYLIKEIILCRQEITSGKALLNDILVHCKRTEIFDKDIFRSRAISEIASAYIVDCEKSRLINTVVKQFIEGGLL